MDKSGERFYIVFVGSRTDLLPSGYYGAGGRLVASREGAARFAVLAEVLKFVEDHKIWLGSTCYIGLTVENLQDVSWHSACRAK